MLKKRHIDLKYKHAKGFWIETCKFIDFDTIFYQLKRTSLSIASMKCIKEECSKFVHSLPTQIPMPRRDILV